MLTWGCCSELVYMHPGTLDWVPAAEQDAGNSYSSGASLPVFY